MGGPQGTVVVVRWLVAPDQDGHGQCCQMKHLASPSQKVPHYPVLSAADGVPGGTSSLPATKRYVHVEGDAFGLLAGLLLAVACVA